MSHNEELNTRMETLNGQIQAINKEITEERKALERLQGMSWSETWDTYRVKGLRAQMTPLMEEQAKLGIELTKVNLSLFQLEDLEVTTPDGKTHMLSEMCRPQEQRKTPILLNDEEIGYVDSDGGVRFTTAPDLRTCVGWAVVTDMGRERTLEKFNLDYETNKLEYAMRAAPNLSDENVLRKYFFEGTWHTAITEVMAYGKGSRFGDGHCPVLNLFWTVAMRSIHGREHSGFRFCY
ncbi:MAG: hypothetical protein V1848_01195 [Candidatus Magasanikbacteria bacterium]